jgi:polar amino acid transport system substrate-binding protein
MRKLTLVLLCALALGACVSPPEDIDRVPNFDPAETLMGQIQERGELLVGIPETPAPPFWVVDDAGQVDGFLADLSRELAEALGVDVEFVRLNEDDLLLPGRVEEESPADVAFVESPATETLAKAHPLTHPYWVAHQRILVPADSTIEEWSDIDGNYCSIIDPETGFDLSAAETSISQISSEVAGCSKMLKKDEVEAVTAPDHILMAVWADVTGCSQPCLPSPDYEIVGDELTTAGYSAMLPLGSPGWTSFVNATWGEAEAEGRWLEYYEEWIAPFGIELEEAPDMTIEEAAGLFPSGTE